MIRSCDNSDFERIFFIINSAAQVYKGVIPGDCWKKPYMSYDELSYEMDDGVVFWGYYEEVGGDLVGIMGIQPVGDVTLIRHAYVLFDCQNQGVGGELLSFLCNLTKQPVLVGTWAAASWAVGFYEKYGFMLVTPSEKDRLLKKYWSISSRQVETSVVLADKKWFASGTVA